MKTLNNQDLEALRQQMFKFATLQLRSPERAEDVVQEALLSAYQNRNAFKGQSGLKTWVFAILKNKILDELRQQTLTFSELQSDDEDDITERLFLENGSWNRENYESEIWHNEASAVYSAQFWAIFEACLNHLPAQQARVFMMRAHLELESEEICQICAISSAYLHTLLYRARLQLQVCLSHKWFGEHHV